MKSLLFRFIENGSFYKRFCAKTYPSLKSIQPDLKPVTLKLITFE